MCLFYGSDLVFSLSGLNYHSQQSRELKNRLSFRERTVGALGKCTGRTRGRRGIGPQLRFVRVHMFPHQEFPPLQNAGGSRLTLGRREELGWEVPAAAVSSALGLGVPSRACAFAQSPVPEGSRFPNKRPRWFPGATPAIPNSCRYPAHGGSGAPESLQDLRDKALLGTQLATLTLNKIWGRDIQNRYMMT